MRTEDLFKFINERHHIWDLRNRGVPKPWTDDPILQQYKFCNVYRELDTQTIWLSENWRNDEPDFWFAALVFRLINWGPTAEALGYPVPFKPSKFQKVLMDRKSSGEKVYSSAYMISTHGVREPKHSYLAASLHNIWKVRNKIQYKSGETLAEFHRRLMGCFDVGSFLAAQVIADAKYVGEMKNAPDWWTFAASGPGSRRGLNRVFSQPLNNPWKEVNWKLHLDTLYAEIEPLIRKTKMPPLHAQDLQNCLCEFDKYERARLGEGRPKSKYPGV